MRATRTVTVVEVLTILAALLCAFGTFSPPSIERWFSTGFYPRLQRLVTPLSNRVSFAILDLLLVLTLFAVAVILWRAIGDVRRTRRVSVLLRPLRRAIASIAFLYLIFLFSWGFNYRRVQMTDRLVIDRTPPSTEDVVRLGLEAVQAMNDLHAAAHADASGPEWQSATLRRAYDVVQHALSDAPAAEPGRLKRSVLTSYFRWTGVDGMINPFGLEVLANPDLLPFERPFVTAHEWGHLAGYADEADANFVGWLTCMAAAPAERYSGWFYLYWQISGELGPAERARVNAALGEGPRQDIAAVVARLRRNEIPALQQASWKIYDKYLKANRVQSGIRSYGQVVNLVLRARYQNGWTPVRRSQSPGVS